MRKFMVLPMAGILALAVAAPVSAGPNVSNSSGSALTVQGSWFSEAEGTWTYGSLYAWQGTGSASTYIDFFEESGQYVDCTPADDTDEFYGFQGQYRYGGGEGTLSIGQGLSQAHAAGTLDIVTVTIDDCIGHYDESWAGGVPVSLDLVATGPKVMERGTWSFKIPSDFNGHSTYSTTYRPAAGTVAIGDEPAQAVEGGLGKVSWRDHSNG